MASFSDRLRLTPPDADITVRYDAPEELRSVVVSIAYECGFRPKDLRTVICGVLRLREDPGNWSEYPNIDDELRRHLERCEWFEVYDIVEQLALILAHSGRSTPEGVPGSVHFEAELNKYFRRRGIGWQLHEGRLETRGSEDFEYVLNQTEQTLRGQGRPTAATEIREAIRDLSRRPEPDATGAIQHALAALECVARDATGDPKSTLGSILQRNPTLVPPPLNQALEKLWGFASEQGRHLREGRAPDYLEAEVAVQAALAVANYLSKRFPP
jgi:hypothetical protein